MLRKALAVCVIIAVLFSSNPLLASAEDSDAILPAEVQAADPSVGWNTPAIWRSSILSVAGDPANPDFVWAAADKAGPVRFDVSALSWEVCAGGMGETSLLQLVVTSRSGRLWAVTPNYGVYVTDDAGQSWARRVTGLPVVPTSLVVDALDADRCFALTVRGLYRTDDAGYSWVPSGAGLPATGPMTSLTLDGQRAGAVAAVASGSVFVSLNSGVTWNPAVGGRPSGAPVTSTVADPATASRLYAGTAQGLWVSDDWGTSWRQCSQGMSSSGTVSLIVPDARRAGIVYAVVAGVLFKSRDAGLTWADASLGLPDGTIVIVPDPIYEQAAYALYGGRVYRTLDSAQSWAMTDMTGATALGSASNGVVAALGSMTVTQSRDGGTTWARVTCTPGPVQSGVWSPAQHATFLTDGSTVSAIDGTRAWGGSVAGRAIANPRTVTRNPRTGTVLAVATMDGGQTNTLSRSSDDGLTWVSAAVFPSNPSIPIALEVSPVTGTAYASCWSSSGLVLYRSGDDGLTWTPVVGVPVSSQGSSDQVPVVVSPVTGTTYASSWSSVGWMVYRSADDGATWGQLTGTAVSYGAWGTVSVSPASNTVYVSLVDGSTSALFRSVDDGVTWGFVSTGSSLPYSSSVSCSPTTGTSYIWSYAGLLRSADDGLTWEAVAGTPVNCGSSGRPVVFLPLTGTSLVAAFNCSVWVLYRSADDGLTWAPMGGVPLSFTQGYPAPTISVSPATGTVYVSLYGSIGWMLYRSADDGFTWVAVTGVAPTRAVPSALRFSRVTGVGYVAGAAGMYRSTDDGLTWHRDLLLSSVLMAPQAAGQAWLGCGTTGALVVSHDDGASWQVAHDSTEGAQGLSLTLNGNGNPVLFAPVGVRYTTDGHTWTLGPYLGISALGTTSADGTLPAVVPDGIVWLDASGGVVSGPGTGLGQSLQIVVTDPTNARRAWAAGPSGTGSTTVYRTTDAGSTWTPCVVAGLSFVSPVRMCVDATGSTLIVAAGTSLARSVDGGLSWSSSNVGLPTGMEVGALGSVAGRLYLSRAWYLSDLYCSINGGQSWYLTASTPIFVYPYQGGVIASDADGKPSWWIGSGQRYGRLKEHTLTNIRGENGSMFPSGVIVVREPADGNSAASPYFIVPNPGYLIDDVLVNGLSVRERLQAAGNGVSLLILSDVRADHTIEARFRLPTPSYTLSRAVVGTGAILRTPDQPLYLQGSSVQVQAIPANGWAFVGWSGDLAGTANPATVVMDGDKSVTATFVAALGSLTDEGNVASLEYYSAVPGFPPDSPPTPGVAATLPGQYVYTMGEVIHGTVTFATVVEGGEYRAELQRTDTYEAVETVCAVQTAGTFTYAFELPTASVSYDGPYDVVVREMGGDAESAVVARVYIQYNLIWTNRTIGGDPGLYTVQGKVTRGEGQSVTTPVVVGIAYPDDSMATCYTIAPGSPGQFALGIAVFSAEQTGRYRVFVRDDYDRQGYPNPPGTNPGTTPDNDAMVYERLSNGRFVLSVNTSGPGSVTRSPDQASYADGTIVTLTAEPGYGWHLASWSGALSGSTNPVTVTMDSDKSVVATFGCDTTPVNAVTAVLSNYAAGQLSAYTATFSLSATGALRAEADWIEVYFPAGSAVPVAISADSVMVNGVAPRIVLSSGSWVGVAVPTAIAGGTSVDVDFSELARIRNPSNGGAYALQVRTSRQSVSGTSNWYAISTPRTVTSSVVGGNGSLSPASQTVGHGSPATVTITPDPGYVLASLTDNGVPVSPLPVGAAYTISAVTGPHTVVGVFSPFSVIPPTLLWPTSGEKVANLSPILRWSTVPGIGTFTLEVATSPSFGATVASLETSLPQAQVPGLANGTTYYWRVRSEYGGSSSAWSGTESFMTRSGVHVWPGDTDGDGDVDIRDFLALFLHWGKTGNARFEASTAWTEQVTPGVWDPVARVYGTGWAPPDAVYADASGAGTIDIVDFDTVLLNWGKTHPSSISPSYPSSDATVELSPSSVTAAAGAEFSVDVRLATALADVRGITLVLQWDPSLLQLSPDPLGRVVLLSPDLPGGTLKSVQEAGHLSLAVGTLGSAFSGPRTLATVRFRVRAGCPSGQTTISVSSHGPPLLGVGSGQKLETRSTDCVIEIPLLAPVLLEPADGATVVIATPRLTWSASSGATSYRVQLAEDSGFQTLVVDSDVGNNLSIISPALADHAVYYWRVQSLNSTMTSVFSAARALAVDVDAGPVAGLTVLSPNGGEQVPVRSQYVIAWSSTGLTQGDIQVFYSMTASTPASVPSANLREEKSAATAGGWLFIGSASISSNSLVWSVPDTVSASCAVFVGNADDQGNWAATDASDRSFAIVPVQEQAYALTVAVVGSGSVLRSPSFATYPSGTLVTLSASANPGYTFAGWTGATPDGVDPLKATVTMDGNKTVTATFVLPDTNALITHYYSSLLSRSPDEPGRLFWLSEIARLQSLGIDVREGFIALARLFLTSPEYVAKGTSDAAYVTALYKAFFNRDPDPDGFTHWTDLMAGGMSRDITMNWFVYSPEYAAYMTGILGSTPTRPENNLVNDLYRGFLNRLPDSGGFANQLAAMRVAQATGAAAVRTATRTIALNFLGSPEYALRARTNIQFIEDCYNGILRRGADTPEIQGWMNVLNAGATRIQVLTGFVNSPEFQTRVDELIAAGPFVP